MKKELLKGLSEEQIAKIKACKSHEDLLTLAKSVATYGQIIVHRFKNN